MCILVIQTLSKEVTAKTSVRQFCEENGITLNVSYVTDPSSENGTILYQNMSPGSKVTEGATLNIKVVKTNLKVRKTIKILKLKILKLMVIKINDWPYC